MSKKIIFLIGNLNNTGGTERVTTIIANALEEKGYKVNITSFFEGLNPKFEVNDKIVLNNLFKNKKNIRALFYAPQLILKLRKLLNHEKPEILIVVETMSVLFTIPAVYNLKIKHIAWEHFNFKSNLGKKGRDLARILAARYCDTVVVLTDKDKQYWSNNTKHNNNIISIPNPSPYEKIEQLGEKNSKVVIAVGRLSYQKGFDILIKSWKIVSQKFPDWKLIILGEGDDRRALEEKIIDLELTATVDLRGNVSNIQDYYKNAEILCMSSRYEGFPMVLLEVLSFGLPIVSFDCDTGPKEILEGTSSILVEPNNTKKLADGLITMISSPKLRENTAISCLKKSEEYLIKNIINDWLSILELSKD